MRHVDSSVARREFSRLYHEVAYGAARIVIDNHGKGLVALVPAADLPLLESSRPSGRTAPRRADVIALLKAAKPSLRKAGVRHIAIFGSVARESAGPNSDVDVLVDLDPEAHVDLIDFVNLRDALRLVLDRDVDLISLRALDTARDAHILEEAAYAF